MRTRRTDKLLGRHGLGHPLIVKPDLGLNGSHGFDRPVGMELLL